MAVTLGGTLSFTLLNGFTPAKGQTFEIINNDGTDPVSGTFAGLAEGATFTQGGITYSFSYHGGTGNDVVLTVENTPGPPPPNPPPPSGTTADMITVRGSDGNYGIYDLGNNSVLAFHQLTNIASPSQVVGIGNFSGSDTSDLAVRNGTAFQFFDVVNNNVTQTGVMGAVGTEWSVVGTGKFGGSNFTDMMIRKSSGAGFAYDTLIIRNNQFAGANTIAAVSSEWQTLGFGDVNGDGTKDMVLRNTNNGTLEYYDIANGQLASSGVLGGVGSEWQVIGFGNFDNSGFSDMIMRNSNDGAYDLFEIRNNHIVGAHQIIATLGSEWQLAGFADVNGDGTDDMLLRNSQNGDFELYDISNGMVTSTKDLGAAGLEWQVVGTAPFQLTPSRADPGPSSLMTSDPGPSSGSGGSQFITSDPGPFSFMASDPGPSSFTTSDPGPSLFMASDPGPSVRTSGWLTQAMQTPPSEGWLTEDMQASGAANQPSLAGTGLGSHAFPIAGSLAASGPGFGASGDPIAGTIANTSLAMPTPLQTHTV